MSHGPYRLELPMAPAPRPEPSGFDLLRLPLLGPLLRRPGTRVALQFPLLLLALIMIVHGLAGPQLAPKNLATTLGWVHYRGALVLVLLLAGNFFCLACPLMLARRALRRFITPRLAWPRPLRNKWLALTLLALVLYCYERFALWSSPALTAWVMVAYFAGALIVDSLFKHAAFCKFVCPIGQFNFVASAISPLEVKVRDPKVCAGCRTKDCIRGRRGENGRRTPGRGGCELALFQPLKGGNMDCTFYLDCVHACPHDNIGLLSRRRADELVRDDRRSGIGRFSQRRDLAALVVVFTFGALVNALGMVSPVYAFERRLASALHTTQRDAVLGLLFFLALVVAPALLVGGAGGLTRAWSGERRPLMSVAARYVHCLVPFGFSVWLAHYGFHFLTGFWTFVPVTQSALADLGVSVLGTPRWDLSGLPATVAHPLELASIGVGLLGSLATAWRIAEDDAPPARRPAAFAPWAGLCVLLWLAAAWILSQPMDMRGTFLGSGN